MSALKGKKPASLAAALASSSPNVAALKEAKKKAHLGGKMGILAKKC